MIPKTRTIFGFFFLVVSLVLFLDGFGKGTPLSTGAGTPGCSSQTFRTVSTEVWNCFKAATSLQEGFSFPLSDSGRVSHRGATISYKFDPNAQIVEITVEDKPFFRTCGSLNNRIAEHVTDCHGPTITGPIKVENREQWKIEKPNVRSPLTAYSQIKLRHGDQIRIDAGGCVQTGGGGSTWKLYVDPKGAKSPNLFHGTIKLPGMSGPQTLREFVTAGNNHQIRQNFSGDMKLYLGYQDDPDQYANNGYWGHDNGDPVQCKGIRNAWVLITIYHP